MLALASPVVAGPAGPPRRAPSCATTIAVQPRTCKGSVLGMPGAGRQHRRRQAAAPQAAAPAAGPVLLGELVQVEATGVPLLDELMELPVEAVWQAGLQAAAATLVATVVGSLALHTLYRALHSGAHEGEHKGRLRPLAILAGAALGPAKTMLPFWGVSRIATVAAAVLQVAARKLKRGDLVALCHGQHREVLSGLTRITQLLQDTSELIFVVWVTWAALTLKQRVVEVLEEHLRSRRDAASEGIVLLLRPVSGVLTALILLLSTLGTLRAFGVDIAALLAATGSLGLVAALATQSLCANLAAALAIYAGRPFVVGDRVQLRQASSVVAEGTVVAIEPMRTILRDHDGNPVYVNNSQVINLILTNLTQGTSYQSRHIDG